MITVWVILSVTFVALLVMGALLYWIEVKVLGRPNPIDEVAKRRAKYNTAASGGDGDRYVKGGPKNLG